MKVHSPETILGDQPIKTVDESTPPPVAPKVISKPSTPETKVHHKKPIRFFVLGFVILLVVAIGVSVYPILQIVGQAKATATIANEAVAALEAQNLDEAKQKLDKIASKIAIIEGHYKILVWWRFTPLRSYYNDGQHAINTAKAGVEAGQSLTSAVTPYLDVLGFKGEGTFTGGTTEDRIVAILNTIKDISPSVDTAVSKLTYARDELNAINPKRYQFTVQGHELSSELAKAQEIINGIAGTAEAARPAINLLPEVAGVEKPKKYLVLFQNDAELRPTGGFMTAYAIMEVNRGKVIPQESEDIYDLDNRFKKRLAPPDPIKKYLPLVTYWYLRDMNISPDFKVSMDTFMPYYKEVPGQPMVDGIIAIDTNVLKNLVEILGPIDVPGFGSFNMDNEPKCNCPQVIYKLEDQITRPLATLRVDRKAVLGPLMQTILQKAYDADSNAWPALFQLMFKNINEKHILFYFTDERLQKSAEDLNVAGRIRSYDGDYLHINDANFGGAKSNMFVTQEVEQEVKLEGNQATTALTIVYKNPMAGSNCNLEAGQLCLNGVLRDFMRVYLPKGSTLSENMGFDEGSVKTYDELDKTVVEGFFKLDPQSQAKLRLVYKTAYQPENKQYKILIQKQPGTYSPKYKLTVNDQQEEFELLSDKEVKFDLE